MERFISVAVIDAHPDTRQWLIRRLQRTPGITVVGEAAEPDEALKIVRNQQPHVVVMDVRRIDRNAAEFVDRMAVTVPHSGIVILTAYVTEQERSELMRAGARAILLKEIDSERLVRTIQTVAARLTTDKQANKQKEVKGHVKNS